MLGRASLTRARIKLRWVWNYRLLGTRPEVTRYPYQPRWEAWFQNQLPFPIPGSRTYVKLVPELPSFKYPRSPYRTFVPWAMVHIAVFKPGYIIKVRSNRDLHYEPRKVGQNAERRYSLTLQSFINQVSEQTHIVYLIYNGIDVWPRFKIGITGQPVQMRLNRIREKHRRAKVVVRTGQMSEKDSLNLERMLHERYKAVRVGGEWFTLDKDAIRTLCRDLPRVGVQT